MVDKRNPLLYRLLADLEALWLKDAVLCVHEIADVLVDYSQNRFDAYVKYTSNQVYQERILTQLRSVESKSMCNGYVFM